MPNFEWLTRTKWSNIFQVITRAHFDMKTQGLPQFEKHFESFQKKIEELDRTGFGFTRDEVISVLFQITFGNPLFDRINYRLDCPTPRSDLDKIVVGHVADLATSQVTSFRKGLESRLVNPPTSPPTAFKEHFGSADTIPPGTPESSRQNTEVNPRKRPTNDAQVRLMKVQRTDDPNYHRFLEQQDKPVPDHAVEVRSVNILVPPPTCQTSTSTRAEETQKLTTGYNRHGGLSNATLLTTNSHDKLHFDRSEVVMACHKLAQNTSTHQESSMAQDSSKKVKEYLQTLGKLFESHVHEDGALTGALDPEGLWIDSNSKLSPALWLTIVYESWVKRNKTPPKVEELRYVYHLQQVLHRLSDPTLPKTNRPVDIILSTVVDVAQVVSNLASQRLAQYPLPDLTIKQLLNLNQESLSKEKESSKNKGEENESFSNISERIILHQVCQLWDCIHASIRVLS